MTNTAGFVRKDRASTPYALTLRRLQGENLNCSDVYTHNTTLLTGNIGVRYAGRMANNMIQYLFARALADALQKGVVNITPKNGIQTLNSFPRVHYFTATRGSTEKATNVCPQGKSDAKLLATTNPEFAQDYLYLRKYRGLAKCIFQTRSNTTHVPLGDTDLVIHLRDPTMDFAVNVNREIQGGTAYITEIVSRAARKHKLSKIYIVTDPKLYTHPAIRKLQSTFGAILHKGSPSEDMALMARAGIFVGSFGTFSWMAAFLSEGREIHLPYLSSMPKGVHGAWLPFHALFIHDDPRIMYHDILGSHWESGQRVQDRNTSFARAVRFRKIPCGGLL